MNELINKIIDVLKYIDDDMVSIEAAEIELTALLEQKTKLEQMGVK